MRFDTGKAYVDLIKHYPKTLEFSMMILLSNEIQYFKNNVEPNKAKLNKAEPNIAKPNIAKPNKAKFKN